MSDLEPIQRSRLGEIGQLLAQARAEKGLSLEEVSGKTLIRATILKAIEEGDARPLPEAVYIRGFIRRFGDLVGLNGMELCDSFPWQPSSSVPLSFVSAGNLGTVDSAPARSVSAAAPVPEPQADANPADASVSPEISRASPAEIAAVAAPKAGAPLPEMEDGSHVTQDDDGKVDAPESLVTESLDVGAPELVEAEPAAALALEEPQEAAASRSEDKPEDKPEALVEERGAVGSMVGGMVGESAALDHEAAYASRAALFGEDGNGDGGNSGDEDSNGFAGATTAAIAAMDAASSSSSPNLTGSADSEDALGGESTVPASVTGPAVATLPAPPAPVLYREPEQRNLMPWIVALVAGVVGLGLALLAFGGGDRPNAANVANEPAAVEQGETADNGTAADTPANRETSPGVDPSITPAAAVPADKVVLELEVRGTEAAWMDVFVDGQLQIEGNQAPGFKQRWEGDQEIELATARPDMVWISVNGSQPQPFGKFEEANPVKIAGFKPANAQ